MATCQIFKSWYKGNTHEEFTIVDDAFKAAKLRLEKNGDLQKHATSSIEDVTSIEDVQRVVAEALEKYKSKSESSKLRKWLERASETICHFGTVLDVFVQHHPEYVSLVWGTMKLLFVGVINHTGTLRLLAKSVCQLTRRLPRIRIASTLYPTQHIRLAVEGLYSCILEFLLMAQAWCNESKFQHVYHSLTRPYELRYNDLLERISSYSDDIIELAAIGSQAELRIMHNTQIKQFQDTILALDTSDKHREEQMEALGQAVARMEISGQKQDEKLDAILHILKLSGITITQLLEATEAFQAIQTSAQLNTNQRLSDIQLSQILNNLQGRFEDPHENYQHHLLLRKRRAAGLGASTATNEFWRSPALAKFSSEQKFSVVTINGGFKLRVAMHDFAIDVIQALNVAGMPAISALPSTNTLRLSSTRSTTDTIRYIVYQALRLGTSVTEKDMTLSCYPFNSSQTEKEWLDLLCRVLLCIVSKQLYLIIDLSTIQSPIDNADGTRFLQQLHHTLEELSNHANAPKVKIILLNYEMYWSSAAGNTATSKVAVKSVAQKRPKRNGGRNRVKKHFFPTAKANP